jgi:hypothetical protein
MEANRAPQPIPNEILVTSQQFVNRLPESQRPIKPDDPQNDDEEPIRRQEN